MPKTHRPKLRELRAWQRFVVSLTIFRNRAAARLRSVDPPERGDVPGWVMVTLMSAILVAAILAVAAPALTAMFNDAMRQVQK